MSRNRSEAQKMAERTAQAEEVFDVVCGKGIRPAEAVASRAYKGETYYFCCRGCAEAFDRDPESYIGKEPVRAYRAEEKVVLGPEQQKLREAEAAASRYDAEIAAAEERSRMTHDNVERMRKELDGARNRLNQRRAEMQALGKQEADIRSALKGDEQRVADMERQVQKERTEYENAERALAEARKRRQDMLSKQQSEIESLSTREKGIEADVSAQDARIRDLEARINQLQGEAADADRRAAQLRDAKRAAEDELNRIRGERREAALEGLPGVPGEEPAEFYAERRKGGSKSGSSQRK